MKRRRVTASHTITKITHTLCQWLVGFADNNSIMLKLENMGYEDTAQPMLEAMKRCLEVWHRLVHIMGGEMELTKSSPNGVEAKGR